MRKHLFSTIPVLALAAGVLMGAGPAHADTADTAFLDALSRAGAGFDNQQASLALGKSLCPMLVEPGKDFASAVAKVRGDGVPPAMAALFAGIAIQAYCPSMVSSIGDGSILGQLGSLGRFAGSNGFQMPGL
jgi:hypothetical protein